jgi:enterochelin esterase family protein
MKGDNGVWSTTIGPVTPAAYRYNFSVDGSRDDRSAKPSTSESNANTWSLLYVPGAEFMDTRNVPHGVVSTVHYFSTALNTWRRMHVYTPPGYELANEKMPVFYLLHGAGDSDDSWTSAGRANFILDNLIAAKKAKTHDRGHDSGHIHHRDKALPADSFRRPMILHETLRPT